MNTNDDSLSKFACQFLPSEYKARLFCRTLDAPSAGGVKRVDAMLDAFIMRQNIYSCLPMRDMDAVALEKCDFSGRLNSHAKATQKCVFLRDTNGDAVDHSVIDKEQYAHIVGEKYRMRCLPTIEKDLFFCEDVEHDAEVVSSSVESSEAFIAQIERQIAEHTAFESYNDEK